MNEPMLFLDDIECVACSVRARSTRVDVDRATRQNRLRRFVAVRQLNVTQGPVLQRKQR